MAGQQGFLYEGRIHNKLKAKKLVPPGFTPAGSDANAPATLGGPNIDNIYVTMTYDDTVIAEEIVEEIEEVFENLEEVFEYIEFSQVEELFEELITFFEEHAIEMEVVEEFEEVSFEPVLMMIEEMPMEEELIEEEMIEELVMEEESMIEEEFTEEAIEEEFTEEEMIEEEPTKLTEAPSEREEVKQEKPAICSNNMKRSASPDD